MQIKATRRFCVAALRPRGWFRLPARSALQGVSRLEVATGDPLGRPFKAFHALRSPPATRAPLRGLRRLPRLPPKGGHPPCVCPPSEGLTTEHRHPDRSLETPRRTVIFLPIFQPKVGNTFYMACRRQEQTHTQCRDRDIDWRGTSHFLPWMVK